MKGGRTLTLLAIILLGAALAGNASPALAQGGNGWVAEYFNNIVLSGPPVLVRVDNSLNFVWGDTSPGPGVPSDRFSARWTRAQDFASGTYRFTARSDDGMRVYLDDTIILDAWADHAPDPPVTADVNISAGTHALRVEYYDNSGSAVAAINWYLLTPAASSGAVWVVQYYNNPQLAGVPVAELTEMDINHDWGFGSPIPALLPADNFGVRWTGSPYFPAGTYTFSAYGDDGVRLWVDNLLLIDGWFDSGFTPPRTVSVALSEGAHAVRLEYYEHLEVAAVRLMWTLTGFTQPTPVFVPTPVPTPVVTAPGIWQAEYFNNTELAGVPILVEQFTAGDLNLNWGIGSQNPIVTADNFSARFTRQLYFAGGSIRFAARVDDGFRFYLDGQLLMNEWHTASGQFYFLDMFIPAGNHHLVVEFYEGVGLASLRLYWVYTQPVVTASPVTLQVTASLLNVRSAPDANAPVLGRIRGGEVYTITGQSGVSPVWWRINFGSVQGWVSGNWVTIQGDINSLPVG